MNIIYHLIKNSIRVAFKVFYRKIFFSGREKIPTNKKMIFAVNHPTAFTEPLLVASFLKQKANVLLRGDAFASKFAIWILRQIKTIPIFRSRDGMANLRKNEEIMEEIKDKLHSGKEHILILAEGTSEHRKNLRPIQKGTARMLFDTYEKYGDTDLCVVPIAVNYTDANVYRSFFSAEVCAPILLENYLDLYKENKAKAIKKLTTDIQTAMKAKVVNIENRSKEDLVNILLDINRNDLTFKALPLVEKDMTLVHQEWQIAENINNKSLEDLQKLAKKTDAYTRLLHEYRVDDFGAAQSNKSNFLNWLLLFIGFPFHIIGFIWNYPPLRLAANISNKKSPEIKFIGSICIAVGYLIWFSWYFFWIIGTWTATNWIIALGVAIFMPLLGRISLMHCDLRGEVNSAYCFNGLSKAKQKAVRKMRSQLLESIR